MRVGIDWLFSAFCFGAVFGYAIAQVTRRPRPVSFRDAKEKLLDLWTL